MLRYKPAHFALAGLAGWLLLAPAAEQAAVREPLALGPERIAALREGWTVAMGREPGEAELLALERQEIDDEILFREALARSLHRLDPVVKQRLLLNMRFLDPQTRESDERLFEQAIGLGMHENDVVVRRRLVQIMELSIQEGADRAPVSDAELAAMYERRREELALPARWRITQVYFSADRRKDRAPADARAALQQLQREALAPEAALALGDPFLGGHQLPLLNALQLAGQFGEDFARALGACATGTWCGPIASSYGEHLVRVEEAEPGRMPGLDEPDVRRRLESDVARERARRTLADAMVTLRQKYGVQS
ncbi:MAG: peptidyl-prolyl cis-trans isomerase [Pseudomonadales bacterium]|nr:peptidyl-prolyl cis-trans isomerase [Pseudomonadales bacterium]